MALGMDTAGRSVTRAGLERRGADGCTQIGVTCRSSIAALAVLVGLAILGGCEREGSNAGASDGNAASSSTRTATLERSSQDGLYRVSLRRASPERPDHVVHDWLVRVEDADGRIVRPARLAFSGGMPQHGHGFQTAPFVTEALDGGWFRIGGVRFHMAGVWTLRVELVGPAGPDAAIFELAIEP